MVKGTGVTFSCSFSLANSTAALVNDFSQTDCSRRTSFVQSWSTMLVFFSKWSQLCVFFFFFNPPSLSLSLSPPSFPFRYSARLYYALGISGFLCQWREENLHKTSLHRLTTYVLPSNFFSDAQMNMTFTKKFVR